MSEDERPARREEAGRPTPHEVRPALRDDTGGSPGEGATRAMSDEVRRALRALPPTEPGPRFTAAVMARLERPPAVPRRPLPAWAAAAVVVAALAGVWGTVVGRAAMGERRKAELRSESAAIAAELQALREQAAQPAPLLYLGGTEEVDVVLDLSALPVAAAVRVPGAATGDGRVN